MDRAFASRDEWEAWLRDDPPADGVWLLIPRAGSGVAGVTHAEALELALCFGWIDAQKSGGDETHWRQRFMPRTARSRWSKVNRAKAEALIDWREAATSILRRVRAFNPSPIAETGMNGTQLRIWDAELVPGMAAATPSDAGDDAPPPGSVVAASSAGIDVACGGGRLRLLRLQLAGRKPLAAPEFLKSQRVALTRFASP